MTRGNAGSSHDRILIAARTLFARRGYVQTSTAQVAREAATSESQLVKHFGSKEGLLEALFEAVWADVNAHVGRLTTTHPDPVLRLKAIVWFMLARFAENSDLRRLMLFEGRRIGSRGAALTPGFLRFIDYIDAVLKEAKRSRRFRVALAPGAVRSLLIGACEGLMRDRLLAEDSPYPAAYSQKDIARAIDTLIDSFLTDESERAYARPALAVRKDPAEEVERPVRRVRGLQP
jgi:AcrR family transcriptional regulator